LREELPMSRSRPDVVIASVQQLRRWALAVSIAREPVRLRLDLPGLSADERQDWARSIERPHNDCGCTAAAVALIAAVVGVAAAAIVHAALGGALQPGLLALGGFGAAVAALFAGQLGGRWWSLHTVRGRAERLARLVQTRAADG
jgi:hypothetical protein